MGELLRDSHLKKQYQQVAVRLCVKTLRNHQVVGRSIKMALTSLTSIVKSIWDYQETSLTPQDRTKLKEQVDMDLWLEKSEELSEQYKHGFPMGREPRTALFEHIADAYNIIKIVLHDQRVAVDGWRSKCDSFFTRNTERAAENTRLEATVARLKEELDRHEAVEHQVETDNDKLREKQELRTENKSQLRAQLLQRQEQAEKAEALASIRNQLHFVKQVGGWAFTYTRTHACTHACTFHKPNPRKSINVTGELNQFHFLT